MPHLSPLYNEIKRLRSQGYPSTAIAKLRERPPGNDLDAFEAVVCLFVCGDFESTLRVCRSHAWKTRWAADIVGALAESLQQGDASRILALARKAVGSGPVPYDASAIYLMLLQKHGLFEEADAYIKRRLQDVPAGETFLLTVMAEIAWSVGNWRDAYRDACAVHSVDPSDFRALIMMSVVTYKIGNVHESLGHALAAQRLRKGSPPAVLQLMRCTNKLGNHYAALGVLETLSGDARSADIHVEIARAYEGLKQNGRATAEYRNALALDPQAEAAVRGLLGIYTLGDGVAELEALKAAYAEEIDGDFPCLVILGIEALNRGAFDEARRLFRKSAALIDGDLPWPVPEPRIRHDCEQLELLERRGRIDAKGAEALALLRRYCTQSAGPDTTFAPTGAEAQALRAALTTKFHVDELPFSGRALGENDYAAIEEKYLEQGIVVIDGFLSPRALEALRRFCEESTVWKSNYQRGYLGAMLAHGFCSDVLLSLAYELKQAMPRVIGDAKLLQAWGYKYDQRLQGINLHADFAKVNVNFWITPDEACEDPTSGGMVVWDLPVPEHWTFYEYNHEPEKLGVYLQVHKAGATKVPHRTNRCVLFDSKLIHRTDEMHFKPGYENRRVNVTLLYGNEFATG